MTDIYPFLAPEHIIIMKRRPLNFIKIPQRVTDIFVNSHPYAMRSSYSVSECVSMPQKVMVRF